MSVNINNDISYQLSLNVLKALGGDTTKPFHSVEEIWDDINGIYDNAGDRLDIEALILDIKNNGLYEYYPSENADAYAPVRLNVNIPQKYTDEYIQELEKSVFQEGYNEGNEEGYKNGYTAGNTDGYTDGYAEGLDDGTEQQKTLLSEVTVKENGVYEREDGYKKVYVEVDIPAPADLRNLIVEVKENKGYEFLPTDYDGWNKVNVAVNVPTGGGGDSGKPKILNGFRFTGGDLSKVDFSQYDWSGVYDCSYLLADCDLTNVDWGQFKSNFNGRIVSAEYMLSNSSSGYSDTNKYLYTLPNLGEMTKDCASLRYLCAYNQYMTDVSNIQYWNTSKVTDMSNMFHYCYRLTTVPLLDTSNVTKMNSMFYRCLDLTTVPLFDTSRVTDMSYMFNNCSDLTTVPLFDTSRVTDMSYMFEGCSKLTSVSLLDTSNVTKMNSMFNSCYALTSVPLLDTSNVTKMSYMFRDCRVLATVPQFDTSKVTDMSGMFSGCRVLATVPQFDTSNVTTMSGMLHRCYYLTTIPQFDTSNVTTMSEMFYDCNSLATVPLFDTSKVTTMSSMFYGCSKLTTLGGFTNMGMQSTFTTPDLSVSTLLTKESIMNVINNLYDRTSAGYATKTLKFGSTNLAKITDEEKAIATNKGWTLS